MNLAKSDLLFLAGCVLVNLVLGMLLFPGAGTDDCFITYQAVDRFVENGRIENLNGQSVEISSSLSHLLILAILKVIFPWSTYWLGLAVSVACGSAAIVGSWWVSMLVFELRNVAKTAALGTALSGPLLYWSWSGMETTFAAVLITALVGLAICFVKCVELGTRLAYRFCFVAAGVGVFLTRPEGFVIVGTTLVFLLIYSYMMVTPHRTKIVYVWSPTIGGLGAVVLAVTVWRWLTFQRLLPNPVYAKASGFTVEKTYLGAVYAFESLMIPPVMVLFTLAFFATVLAYMNPEGSGRKDEACADGRRFLIFNLEKWNIPLALVGACIAVYGATVVVAGGDWMPHGRFLIHVLPLVFCLWSGAIWRLFGRLSRPGSNVSVGIVLTLVIAMSTADSTWVSPVRERRCLWNLDLHSGNTFTEVFQRLNVSNRRDLELFLPVIRPAVQRSISEKGSACLLTGQMGMIPYLLNREFGNKVQFIDRRGLTEADLTRLKNLPRHQWGLGISFNEIAQGIMATDCNNDLERAVCHIWSRNPDIVYGLWFRPSRFGQMARLYAAKNFKVTQFADLRNLFPTRQVFGEHVFVMEAGLKSPQE